MTTLYEIYQSNPEYFDYTCGRSGKKALCDNIKCLSCYQRSFASHKRSLNWDHKNIKTARQYMLKSEKFSFFICECGHSFPKRLSTISSGGHWCSFCAHLELCKNETCVACFEASFASQPNAIYWSSFNKLKSRDVFICSNYEAYFDCPCGHLVLKQVIKLRSPQWCPYCSDATRELCTDNACDLCRSQSFASHPRSANWSATNSKTPREVILNSDDIFNFDCDKCDHTFPMSPHAVNRGSWCPYCSSKKLCDKIDCKLCRDKSFESNPYSYMWNPQNPVTPRQVFRSSGEIYNFICDFGHNFSKSLHEFSKGHRCHICRWQTEKLLYGFLMDIYPTVEYQKKFDWCKGKKGNLPFDFYIPDLNLIIELDGPHHFRQISNWKTPEETQERDIIKMNGCLNKNISIIRLLQEDVLYNRYNWKEQLVERLIIYAKPKIMFLAQTNEYDIYSKLYL
jgi:hypothetical protein